MIRFLAEAVADDAVVEEHFGIHVDVADLYAAIVFLGTIYAAGICAARFLSMPALVGEILIGILLGPNLTNFVPIPEAFVMLGEIGYVASTKEVPLTSVLLIYAIPSAVLFFWSLKLELIST
jgi:H+/Cl- antiporter ClcA